MDFNVLKVKMIFNITHKNKSDVRISTFRHAGEKGTKKNFFHQVNLFRKKQTFSIKISDNNKRKAAQIASYDTSMILALLTHTFMSL